MGAPSHPRHEPQWQYACTFGAPLSSSWTAPQKQPLFRVSGNGGLLSTRGLPCPRVTRKLRRHRVDGPRPRLRSTARSLSGGGPSLNELTYSASAGSPSVSAV